MSEWISVKERLPSLEGLMDDECEYVLVAEYFNITENHCVSICAYTKDGWSEWDSFGHVRPKQITHWMPLPEPPNCGADMRSHHDSLCDQTEEVDHEE